MFIVEVGTEYMTDDPDDKKRGALWLEVGEWVKTSGAHLMSGKHESTFNEDASYWMTTELIVSSEQMLHLLMWKHVKCQVKSDLRNVAASSAFDRAVAKSTPQGVPARDEFNHKVEVHMPGQALSNYNETMLLEDSCTDALQSVLDKGWRIIAACPQPDSRRPDYILGRFNPERLVAHNNGALRGSDVGIDPYQSDRRIRVSDHVSLTTSITAAPDPADLNAITDGLLMSMPRALVASPAVSDPGPAPMVVAMHESGTETPAVAPRPFIWATATPTFETVKGGIEIRKV
ncbi:hypothetical protein JXVLWARM_CDS_0075 [Burkholderia phage Bm1]